MMAAPFAAGALRACLAALLSLALPRLALLPGAGAVDFEHTLKQPVYTLPGDLLLGAILSVHEPVTTEVRCGRRLRGAAVVQSAEALAYAVGVINANRSLLPGIRLGLVVLDDCATPEVALAQALRFVPVGGSSGPGADGPGGRAHYDVVGVLGAESSESSMMVAHLLGMFRVPQISALATSDRLSDKQLFPYFLRTVPPDHFQVEAILHILLHFNWTHVSVVLAKDGYGEGLAGQLVRLAARHGICVAASLSVARGDSEAAYGRAARALQAAGARVVVLLADKEAVGGVLRAVVGLPVAAHFVWVGSDGLGMHVAELGRAYRSAVLGSLSIRFHSADHLQRGFRRHWQALTPATAANPWYRAMWADLHACSWTGRPACVATDTLALGQYAPNLATSRLIDTVQVFALALHDLIRARCPAATGRALRACVDGAGYLKRLLATSLAGGDSDDGISFDANGDVLGRYEIFNFRRSTTLAGRYEATRVATWDAKTARLNMDDAKIEWEAEDGTDGASVPRSTCGRACDRGHIYSYYKNTCCWVCRPCAVNEVTTSNATRCVACPRFTWPDADLTACRPLPVHHLASLDPVVVVFSVVAGVGALGCGAVVVVYVRHNSERLIKATSRELSYIMLAGVVLQLVTLVGVIATPSDAVCRLNYAGFNVGFAVVYSALLTRTNRIYRIFRSGVRTKSLPSFASPCWQVVISVAIIAVQVVITAAVIVMTPPETRLRMPVATEPLVEVACWLPQRGFVCSLSYNLVLVVVCAGYAFKTRSLPNNFNESKYIMLCVYTTLVIWLAFLPTYFTTTRAYVEVVLLSSALALSATVTVLCLYVPKAYAVCAGVSDAKTRQAANGRFGCAGRYSNAATTAPPTRQPACQQADDTIAMDLTNDTDQQTSSVA